MARIESGLIPETTAQNLGARATKPVVTSSVRTLSLGQMATIAAREEATFAAPLSKGVDNLPPAGGVIGQAELTDERRRVALQFEQAAASAQGQVPPQTITESSALPAGWIARWVPEQTLSRGDNESLVQFTVPAHWQAVFDIELFAHAYLAGPQGTQFARVFGSELRTHHWQQFAQFGSADDPRFRWEPRSALSVSSSAEDPAAGGWIIAQAAGDGNGAGAHSAGAYFAGANSDSGYTLRRSQWSGAHPTVVAGDPFRIEIPVASLPEYRPTLATQRSELQPTASADELLAIDLTLTDPLNVGLMNTLTPASIVLDSPLARNLIERYGLERTVRISQLEAAHERLRERFAAELNTAASQGPTGGSISPETPIAIAPGATAKPGWRLVDSFVSESADESGVRQTPAQGWQFDSQAFTRWYAQQPGVVNQAFGQLYTDGNGSLLQLAEGWQTVAANSRDVIDPNAVQFNPVGGLVTPVGNAPADDDWFDTAFDIISVAAIAYAAIQVGPAVAEFAGLTTTATGAGTTLTATGSVVAGAASAGFSATFNGLANDNLSLRSVLRAVLSGALSAGIARLPIGDGATLSTLGLNAAGGDQFIARLGSLVAQSGLRGALTAALGGDFHDGFKQAALQWLAGELSRGVEGLVTNLKLSGPEASSVRMLGQIMASATRIAGRPGHDLQAIAQDWLVGLLPAPDPIEPLPSVPASTSSTALAAATGMIETPNELGQPTVGSVSQSAEPSAEDLEAFARRTQRLAELRTRVDDARALNSHVDPDAFDDQMIAVYELLLKNGNDPREAAQVAHVLETLLSDQELADLFNYGGAPPAQTPPAPHTLVRPEMLDARGAAAYDDTLRQMLAMGADINVARSQAYEVSMLTVASRRIDELDAQRVAGNTDLASPEVARERNRMVAALISRDVYFDSSVPAILPGSVYRMGEAEVRGLGLEPSLLNDARSGYFGAVYKDQVTGQIIVANRGTEFGLPGRTQADMQANALQALGLRSEQYDKAMQIAQFFRLENLPINFTGHSLGGGLASAQAVVANRAAATFNSAGLHAGTTRDYPAASLRTASAQIDAVYIDGELVNTLQDRSKAWVIAAATSAQVNPLGRVFSALSSAFELGPRAIGNRIAIDPMDLPNWRNPLGNEFLPDSYPSLQGGDRPNSQISRQLDPSEAYQQHGINRVIFSLLQRLSNSQVRP